MKKKLEFIKPGLVGLPGMTIGLKLFLTALVFLLGIIACGLFSNLHELVMRLQ